VGGGPLGVGGAHPPHDDTAAHTIAVSATCASMS
jgi:hypothetical protein